MLELIVWNEQYSLGVKAGRALHPQNSNWGTKAPSDLPEVTPILHGEAGPQACSFPVFKVEANTEGLCELPRENRTAGCFFLWLHRINQNE